MIKFNQPYLSGNEEKSISSVMSNTGIESDGHYTKLCESFFENKFGFNKCYLTPSCTSAIEMAMLTLGLQAGDEIIIPSYTFSTCPNPFIIAGVHVVLADCNEDYPNISSSHVKSLITTKTKAIMVMHYGGVACDMDEIVSICNDHQLFLIEDAAQCIGAFYKNKPLGSFGDISVFSFHYTKNITCGEGGLITINNPDLKEKANVVREYGTNRTSFQNGNLPHYEWVDKGLAFFMSEINAAFLHAQLGEIEVVTQKRKELWEYYYQSLEAIQHEHSFSLPQIPTTANPNYHTFFISVTKPKETPALISFLEKQNIATAKHFYPLHLSRFYKQYNPHQPALPNVEHFQNTLIRFPLFYDLTIKEIDFIVAQIQHFFRQN